MTQPATPPTVRATAFVSALCIGHLIEAASATDADRAQLLGRIDLPPRLQFAFEHKVPEDRVLALLDDLAVSQPDLAERAIDEAKGHHSPIFHLATAADCVADLCDIAVRYTGLEWSSMACHMTLDGDHAVLATATVPETPGAHLLQRYLFASMVAETPRFFTQGALRYLKIGLQGPEIGKRWWSQFADVIGYGENAASLVLRREDLDLPLRRPDSRMATWLENSLDRELERHQPPATFAESVTGLVRRTLRRGPDRAAIAERLGVSERTLARRLSAEGTSFRGVVDTVRLQRATELLGNQSVDEVSLALGFADVRSFERAFRRWTGTTLVAWARSRD